MKRLFLVFLCTFSTAAFAGKDVPDVKQLDHGVYWSVVTKEFMYYADTVAQLCYIVAVDAKSSRPTNLAPISCKNLKKRPEWSAVITWE